VQGVSYRAFTQKKAIELGIMGFVQNRPNSDVYLEAEGEAERIDILLAACRRGPLIARVDSISIVHGEPVGHINFEIRK
jgi:acylphosphatase